MKPDRRRPPASPAPQTAAATGATSAGHAVQRPLGLQCQAQPSGPHALSPDAAGLGPAPLRVRSRIESLRLIETASWQELANAVLERTHGWRVMTLATVAGDRADARSVVLREVDSTQRKLVFYTDARSPKAAQIRACPKGTVVGWCPRLSWQLRLKVHLAMETQTTGTQLRWSRLQMTPGAQDYMSPLAPGHPLSDPGRERGERDHFALLSARVEALDWLELHADGHRRAVFDADGARWVQP